MKKKALNGSATPGEETISIGQLSKELGITTRTLRYWEEVGIIESIDRAEGANRGYTPYIVRRIKFILKLKELGLSIRQLQDLYKVYGDAKRTDILVPKLIEILDDHIRQVDSKIAKLASLRSEIVDYRNRMSAKISPIDSAEGKASM